MMKEYEFNPTESIVVREGKKTVVTISGKRVAYSLQGRVISLNGEPEANVVLEAVANASESKGCLARHTETAATDEHGVFRCAASSPAARTNWRWI